MIAQPLLKEWAETKEGIAAEIEKLEQARARVPSRQAEARKVFAAARREEERAWREAKRLYATFIERMRNVRVLDPACGSGNFLYIALLALKDIEHRANLDAEAMGLGRFSPSVGPECLKGIEINPYAAELARVTVWIGEIQWMRRNGFDANRNPILRPLDTIECRDAVLGADYKEADWPESEFIIGNPPFLGAKLMKRWLGPEYTDKLRAAYAGRLKGFSDLVCFWFEKSRAEVMAGRAKRVGLVATSSIRGGTNRPVLDQIGRELVIYNAWSEQPWTVEGARVEVSLIAFCSKNLKPTELQLDGQVVPNINSDLTTGVDLTKAASLAQNQDTSFLGIQTSGPHDIQGDLARQWLAMPSNPNGKHNREILKPYWNGDDVAGRPRDRWLIDLPIGLSEAEAAQYQTPYEYLKAAKYDPESPTDMRTLPDARSTARDSHARSRWWEPYWPRPEMRNRVKALTRYIVTTETSQYRLFVWLRYPILPDKNLIVIARDDDTMFGILHSRFHEIWSLRLGTSLEDRPRYTSTTTFATFPFPKGLTPNLPASTYKENAHARRIAAAAKQLVELRDKWLNPTELVQLQPEAAPGFPDRIMAKSPQAQLALRRLTLTELYNERPTWLTNAHQALDAAVAAAYGLEADISEDKLLAHLLNLNIERQTEAGELELL